MTAIARCTITPADETWPAQLQELEHAPERLHILGGEPARLGEVRDLVTITGSRASTQYGNAVASEIAQDLSAQGRIVVTGGAYGIDVAALRGALSVDATPIVVLASGLDVLYPAGNSDLLESVAERGGLLISEYEDGTRPTRERFTRRSDLLAALSRWTVIVEAGMRSGAHCIVHRAVRLGRNVGAVPGPITSAASAGTNELIANHDAHLITGAHDLDNPADKEDRA